MLAIRNPFSRIAPDATKDKLGPVAKNFHTDALPERQWKVTARAWAIAFFFSLTLNMSLVWAIVAMLPLKESVPYFVSFQNSSQQIYRLDRLGASAAALNFQVEAYVRDYVMTRHAMVLDDAEMARRWGPDGTMWHMSTQEEFARFLRETKPTWEALKQTRTTRAVTIVSASQISFGFWQVEFTVEERDNNGPPRSSHYMASLRVLLLPDVVKYEERLINPLGFHVADYSIATRQLAK